MLLIALGALVSNPSLGQITAEESSGTYVSEPYDDGSVKVVLSPPNNAGISVNTFSSFKQNGRKVDLLNTPRLIESLDGEYTPEYSESAKLIVIVADNIHLDSETSVIGTNSDVLFVSGSGTSLTCSQCSFDNMNLISLVSGNLSNGSQSINNINSINVNGSASINGLKAPGSIGVNIISRNVTNLSGLIDLNIRANKTSTGGYETNPNGIHTIGSGSLNVITGAERWNYDVNNYQKIQLTKSVSTGSISSNAILRAPAVEITAPQNILINGLIDTRVNLLSSVRYHGETLLNNEGVKINQLRNNSRIQINNNIYTDGNIRLSAAGNVNVGINKSLIGEKKITVLAGLEFQNEGSLKSSQIMLASNGLYNRGRFEASNYLESFTDSYFVNDFGGEIIADKILLESEGLVRNGSRTPYLSKNNSHKLNINPTYYLSPELSKLGVFYASGNVVETNSSFSLLPPNDPTSRIVAKNISVNADAFENINPYYNKIGSDTDLQINVTGDELYGVSLKAENTINVSANSYIVNSSAVFATEKDTSSISMSAPNIINERYRGHISVDYLRTDGEIDEGRDALPYNEKVGTYVVVHSPPGMIYSLGELNVDASQSFTNMAGFIEIYEDAEVHTQSFRDYGLALSGIELNSSECLYCSERFINVGSVVNSGVRGYRNFVRDYTGSGSLIDTQEFDSLFYVGGNFLTTDVNAQSDASAIFQTFDTFEYYQSEAVERFVEFNVLSELDDLISTNYSVSTSDPNRLAIQTTVENSAGETETKISETSLVDAVANLYRSLRDTIRELVNEIDFWSEEATEG